MAQDPLENVANRHGLRRGPARSQPAKTRFLAAYTQRPACLKPMSITPTKKSFETQRTSTQAKKTVADGGCASAPSPPRTGTTNREAMVSYWASISWRAWEAIGLG